MSVRLGEGTVDLILSDARANINAAIAQVRADFNDPSTTTLENIQSFFIYEGAAGYRSPALFIILDDFDLRLSEKESNHVSALATVRVSILAEEQDKTRLTYKCYRYQAAIFNLLNLKQLSSPDSKIKLFIRVRRCSFSPVFTDAKPGSDKGVFRKEVVVECDVDHMENF